ncbi:serine hydrolase [Shewanella sp. MBTL60-007]|uniref:serine hydrolase domain-containing protein n=1 Tax=Shewanella sp. MBTL60-007 TaxID=2815911 RepID=UPI001BC34AFF|nr:serine hydrolase [Shewanella sp. MBTL60-007]GIU24430.1 hypothetical protein TUM3792_29170 [Shewanella sp. MBTL60-007]
MKKSVLALASLLSFGSVAVEFKVRDEAFIENAASHAISIKDWDSPENAASTFPHGYKFTSAYYKLDVNGVSPQKLMSADALDLSKLMVSDIDGKIDLETFLRDRLKNHSMVVLKGDRIMHEHYWNNMSDKSTHIDASVTKSFTSMAAQLAVAKGQLDMSKLVIEYLPELKGTAWETATVQDVSDMRTSVIMKIAKHKSWDDRMSDSQSYYGDTAKDYPNGVSDYFPMVTEHKYKMGEAYTYQCVNTEVLGKVVERASGKLLAEYIELIFQSAGTENEAYLVSDHAGGAVAAAGLNASTKDLARIGQLFLNDGKNYKGEQVLSKAWVDSLYAGNDVVRAAWSMSKEAALADGWYKDQFRLLKIENREILAMVGIHGQIVAMDRDSGAVIAMNGGYPQTETARMALSIFYKVLPTIFEAVEAVKH